MSDDRTRSLERAWRAGDPQAGAALAQHLARSGGLTLEWIAQLGPLAHHALLTQSPEVLEAVAFALTATAAGAGGAKARFLCLRDEDWFPHHHRVDVCPRGHAFRPGRGVDAPYSEYSNFTVDDLSTEYRLPLRIENGVLRSEGFVQRYDDAGTAEGTWTFLCCNERMPVAPGRYASCMARWHVRPDMVDYE